MKTMQKARIGLALLLPLAVAGCFTLSQSEYPKVEMTAVADGVKLQMEGFQATVIDYTPIYSTSTYVSADPYWHGPYRRHRRGGMYWGTYTTETYVPTMRNTDVFLQRAISNLEKAGCILRATPATYTVVGSFAGPFTDEMASLKSLGVFLGSVLSARFEMLSYSAEVKVYETASGKLVFNRTYTQDYYASGWSPVPIFGIMDFEKVESAYMKSWCLTALTDRITADVSAWLAGKKD